MLLVKPASETNGFHRRLGGPRRVADEGCAREIKEEIGLDLQVGGLLVLDWLTDTDMSRSR